MFLQRMTQRFSAIRLNKLNMVAVTQRGYYKNDVLMHREAGEYYADPLDVAERVVRLIGLHDSCKDPSAVSVA